MRKTSKFQDFEITTGIMKTLRCPKVCRGEEDSIEDYEDHDVDVDEEDEPVTTVIDCFIW